MSDGEERELPGHKRAGDGPPERDARSPEREAGSPDSSPRGGADLDDLARFVEEVRSDAHAPFDTGPAGSSVEPAPLVESLDEPGGAAASAFDVDPAESVSGANDERRARARDDAQAPRVQPLAKSPARHLSDARTEPASPGERPTPPRPERRTRVSSAAPAGSGPGEPVDDFALIDRLGELMAGLRAEVGRVIVGQHEVIDELLWTLAAGGHALLEGAPGLAKTLLVNTLASALSLRSGRVQFTPDLMPTDVTGTTVVQEDPATGERSFVFRRGPIFTNMLLADEINRTPPKTQASLLEGMSEGRVTVATQRYDLPRPFVVLATQNPIEQEGTYPLPEAQLDRFLLKVHVDYPALEEEQLIVERTTGHHKVVVRPVVSSEAILRLQHLVRSLPASGHIQEYATRLARRTRPSEADAPGWVGQLVAWGAGPRAAQALILAAKARTILAGRFAVTHSDLFAVAHPVLRHRILPSFIADAEGLSSDDIVSRLLSETPITRETRDYDPVTRRLLRL